MLTCFRKQRLPLKGKMLETPSSSKSWHPFAHAIASNLLLWLAYPPVGASPLAWIALVPIMRLIVLEHLPGRQPLIQIWVACFLFWLGSFYFLLIPHPILSIGWLALSAYLAVYGALAVAVARRLIWSWRIPAIVAIPIVYTGLEWVRVNFLTGFGMVCLSHTQYRWPVVIQIADLFGAYAVTFAIALVSACVTVLIQQISASNNRGGLARRRLYSGATFACLLLTVTAVFGYGYFRLHATPPPQQQPTPQSITVAVIQSSLDTVLTPPANQQALETKQRNEIEHRRKWTLAARQSHPELDLVIWPESGFGSIDFLAADPDDSRLNDYQNDNRLIWDYCVNDNGRLPAVPLLTGTLTYRESDQSKFNSAVMVSAGKIKSRYFKNHRVMIGEYIPILEYFPNLMERIPLGNLITPGEECCTMQVGEIKLAPNICFETTVPHLLLQQVNDLDQRQQAPDAIVNLTNDGWFYGTSCLDLHLACNVFRAVELRRPNIVCANTGFSAEIGRDGRILQQGKRREPGFLIITIPKNSQNPLAGSIYLLIGDWVSIGFAAVCGLMLVPKRWSPGGFRKS